MQNKIQIFGNNKIRSVWDPEQEKWYFAIVDVIAVLTESENPQTYWRVLKKRLKDEGNESVTNCNALKLPAADGKMRLTDVADVQQLLRIIQSVPGKKAEPFKVWLSKVGSEILDESVDPELSIDRVGMSSKEYKQYKGLKKENLRDNMTNIELILNMLAEASATELSKNQNPSTFSENAKVAVSGAEVARDARLSLKKRGSEAISPKNAKELGIRQLPFSNGTDSSEDF